VQDTKENFVTCKMEEDESNKQNELKVAPPADSANSYDFFHNRQILNLLQHTSVSFHAVGFDKFGHSQELQISSEQRVSSVVSPNEQQQQQHELTPELPGKEKGESPVEAEKGRSESNGKIICFCEIL
jgi:hypothetical protein